MKCTAMNKHTGQQCKAWAIKGTNVCRVHGGKAPQVRAKGLARLEAAEAKRQVTQLGLGQGTGQIDPRDALELELWRTHVQVMLYQALVDELPLDHTGIYGRTYHVSGRPTGEAKPHVLVVMRDQERDRLAAVAVACAKAGVEERRVMLEEERGRMIADVFRAVFSELGIKPDRGMPVAARHLRLLASGDETA